MIAARTKDLSKEKIHEKTLVAFGALALGLTAIAAVPASAYTGQEFAKTARVGLAQARAIALKAQPGVITDQELEREKGGTGLRYSFDIKGAGGVHEVGVDARTGAVLENAKEGPHPD